MHESQHFFSMAYVDGVSLASVVRSGPLPPRRAAEICQAVAEAVQYAHEKGVIHRDLKPGNVLLDAEGNPRVTDFGLAKLIASDSDLTGTGQALGTPSYMPPEQTGTDKTTIGCTSDIYSLGAILYCLTTGRPPFQAATPLETLLQVQKQEPVAPRAINPEIPVDLDTIILKCLEKPSARRYQTARDLGDELKRFLEGRPILARPVGQLDRFWRWCKREPLIATLNATTILALIVGTAVSLYFARQEGLRAKSEHSARINEGIEKRRAQESEKTAAHQTQVAKNAFVEQIRLRGIADTAKVAAINARNKETQRARELRRSLYLADLNRIAQFARIPNVERMRSLLLRHIPNASEEEDLRSFDWYYWWRLIHGAKQTINTGGRVELIAASHNGRWLAVACEGGQIRLLDATENQWSATTLRQPDPHWAALAFSHDDSMLQAVTSASAIKSWETTKWTLTWEGSPSSPLTDEFMEVVRWPAAISAQRNAILTSDRDRQGMAWWSGKEQWTSLVDLSNGVYIRKEAGDDSKLVAVHQEYIGADSASNHMVRTVRQFWTVNDAAPPPPEQWGAPTFGLAFSPSGRWFADGTRQGEVRIWDSESRKRLHGDFAHQGIVWDVAFSDDERWLASCGEDGVVVLWDTQSGKVIGRCVGHAGPVRRALFLPGNQSLVSAGEDGTLRIWSIHGGIARQMLLGHLSRITSLTLLPPAEGKHASRLVSASSDQTVRVWDLDAPPNTIAPHSESPIMRIAASIDGKIVVGIDAPPKSDIHVWDPATGQLMGQLDKPATARPYYDNTSHITLNSNRHLAARADRQSITVWDVDHRTPRIIIRAGQPGEETPNPVVSRFKQVDGNRSERFSFQSVAFSPDGAVIAAACSDGKLRTWDSTTGVLVSEFRLTDGTQSRPPAVNELAYLPDGKALVYCVGNNPNEVRVRRLAEEKDTILISETGFFPRNLAVSPTGDVAVVTLGGLALFDVEKGERIAVILDLADEPRYITFSPGGEQFATVSRPHLVQVWDARTRTVLQHRQFHGEVRSPAFIRKGLLAVPVGATVELWDVHSNTITNSLAANAGPVYSICLQSPDKVMAASRLSGRNYGAVDQSQLTHLDLATGNQVSAELDQVHARPFILQLPHSLGQLTHARIRVKQLDSPAFSNWSWDRRSATGERLPDSARVVAVSPEGQFIVYCRASDNRMFLFNLRTAAAGPDLPISGTPIEVRGQRPNSATFSADGSRLAVAIDNAVEIMDPDGGNPITLTGHAAAVHCIDWAPVKNDLSVTNMLASGALDGSVRLWNADTGREARQFQGHVGAVNSVKFTSDGKTVISGGSDGAILIWDLGTGEIRLRLNAHDGPIHDLIQNTDGTELLSAGNDGTIRIWRADRHITNDE